MASRMGRYDNNLQRNKPNSRLNKNKNLYEDFYNQTIYKEIKETPSDDRAVNLNEMKLTENTTRENYHRIKEFQDVIDTGTHKKAEDLSTFFHINEEKVYDINSVLVAAKKNREEIDELDKKRKLRNTDYNILTSMTSEEIANYKKTSVSSSEEDNELADLIHTITTKSLGENLVKPYSINTDNNSLLGDLMPNDLNETVISESLSKDILEKEINEIKDPVEQQLDEVDHSFYTRSMDLSDTDFEDEGSDEFIEKKPSIKTFLVILVAVIITVALAIFTYYFMNHL